jgi:hypothetical protein
LGLERSERSISVPQGIPRAHPWASFKEKIVNPLHKQIYNQLYQLSREEIPPKRERKSSKRSRAHRLEQTLETLKPLEFGPVPTCREKIKAIAGIMDLNVKGFVTDENLIAIIADIVKGE